MGKSFKFLAVTAVVAAMLLAGCATASLPAPTAEEASAFESELGKVLASSGFSGSLGFADKSVRGDYQPGDKLGLYTVTRNSHVRIDVDLSDIFSGGATVSLLMLRRITKQEKRIAASAMRLLSAEGRMELM